ncbi:MAG TPA: kelch repeat-containing protein [Candidatus Saccharimonadales bacterium]|nr:kelch repeat-containing protein [Candidatus Saccharimonadales bacterium]
MTAQGFRGLLPTLLVLTLGLSGWVLGASPGRAEVLRPAGQASLDGRWEEMLGPRGRDHHTAIYDPVRQRMIVFGGYDGAGLYFNDAWALSLTSHGYPAWSRLTPTGTGPDGLYDHSAIYDPVRDRMIVFGGTDGSKSNVVWALSLSGTPAWTQLSPTGAPPSPRSAHNAVYDPVRDRMLVFGGADGSYLNEVWALSLSGTPAWTQLAPTGAPPAARTDACAVYDPAQDRMVVFGGYYYSDAPHYLNDTWALTLSGSPAWVQLSPMGTAPSAREGHAGVYVSDWGCMMVVGGDTEDQGIRGDVWELWLSGPGRWQQVNPNNALGGRLAHAAAYDAGRRQVVVFGGLTESLECANDAWALPLADFHNWLLLAPSAAVPPDRLQHAAAFDSTHRRMLIFGGYTMNVGMQNDAWSLSLAGTPTWSEFTPSGTPPAGRMRPSAIYDPVRDRLIVFGGFSGTPYNDAWALALSGTVAWTQLTPSGTPPAARDGAAAIYDPVRDRMVLFGGYYYDSKPNYLGDTWALSLSGPPAWTHLSPTGTPPAARYEHSAIYDPVGDRMIVFGGDDGGSRNDVWALSLSGTPAWTQLSPSGTPPHARDGHAAAYDSRRQRMLVVGGWYWFDHNHFLGDAWALSLSGSPAWTQLAPAGTPPTPRFGHNVGYDAVADRLLLYAGAESSGTSYASVGDLWSLWLPGLVGVPPAAPDVALRLAAPRPNPARGRVDVEFQLPRAGRAEVRVLDVAGRVVATLANGEFPAGGRRATWDGTSDRGGRAAAGVYVLELRAGRARLTRKVVLLR